MKISLSKSRSKTVNLKESLASLGRLWMRIYRYVFLIAFFVVMLWGGWIGYKDLIAFEWTQERKDLYIASERKKFDFQEEYFNTVVDAVDERRSLYSQAPQGLKNPFYEKTRAEVRSEPVSQPTPTPEPIPTPQEQSTPTPEEALAPTPEPSTATR